MPGKYYFNQEDGTILHMSESNESIPLTQFLHWAVPENRLDELLVQPGLLKDLRVPLYEYLLGELIYLLCLEPEGEQENLFAGLDLILLGLDLTIKLIEKNALRADSRHVQRELNSFIQKRLDSFAQGNSKRGLSSLFGHDYLV